MTIFVKVITRLTLGLIFLLGCYFFVFARNSHGAGFAGGLVIALGLLLFMLAYGKDAVLKRIKYVRLALLKDVCLLLFAALTAVVVFYGDDLSRLAHFDIISMLMLVFLNAALSLASAGCFFLMFLNLLTFKHERNL